MALEKRWVAVSAQTFLTQGTSDGKAQVVNACLFKVKQKVLLSGGGLSREFEVKRINSDTELELGSPDRDILHRSDLSSYPIGSSLSAKEQPRPKIAPDNVIRAVYEEEPTVAYRSLLVDLCGDPIDADNPLPIEGEISIETDPKPGTPNFIRQLVPNKDTEVGITIPNGTKILRFAARGDSRVLYSFTMGGISSNNFNTLKPGNCFYENMVQLDGKTLYVSTNKDNETIEVLAWTM